MIAKDIMTRDLITVAPTMTVKQLAMTLIKNQISGAPVAGKNGKLVGIVSENDIIAKKGKDVKAIMSKQIISVGEETSVEEIAQLMTARKIKRVPVMHGDAIVGIVSRADIVSAIARGEHIALHTPVYDLTAGEFAAEIDRSVAALRAAGAPVVEGFRAPQWSINDRSMWALEILTRKGFRFDSSLTPLRIIGNPSYPWDPHTRSTPAGELLECPPLVERRFGQTFPLGGGWGLRMTAPARVLAAIEQRNRRGLPATLFVHPWEIDPDPPRVPLPLAKRFVHYFRLEGFAGRLEAVLRGARFAPMGEVLSLRPART